MDQPPSSSLATDPRLGRVVVDHERLQARIAELGRQLTVDYAGRRPLLVGVLKGAFMFMSDLARAIDLPVEFDFMAVSSYGSATKTSGVVRIVKDLDLDLTDRDVLLVEDIVDSGLTLHYLLKNLLARGPASLEVCALHRQGRHPEGRARPAATWASASPTSSWWATAWTWPSAIATCPPSTSSWATTPAPEAAPARRGARPGATTGQWRR